MLNFTCPKCGCHYLEEILIKATISRYVLRCDEEECGYGDHTIVTDDCEISHYQCVNCEYVLPGVKTPAQLFRWLGDGRPRENSDANKEFVQKHYADANMATNDEDGMVDILIEMKNFSEVIGYGRTEAQAWEAAADWVRQH
jgi:hypothetical protein